MYVFMQDVPIGTDTYWKIINGLSDEPLPGQLLHLCVRRSDGALRYIDVWASEEACDKAFDDRLHPAVDAAFGGNRPATEPTREVVEVVHAMGSMLDRELRP